MTDLPDGRRLPDDETMQWALQIAEPLQHIPVGDRSQRERALCILATALLGSRQASHRKGNPMTDLTEGRRLLEAATKGPWAMEYSEVGIGPDTHLVAFVMGADEAYVLVDESPDAIDGPPSPNGELVVWLRNNMEALLTAAEAGEKMRKA